MDDNQGDAYNVFGVKKPLNNREESWHREQERRSYDVIRVSNPDNGDFYVEWDHKHTRVPGNGTADMPRYMAVKYCRDKAVDMINIINEKLHKEALEEREKRGLPSFKDKYEENNETYMTQKYPKTNDRELMTKIFSDLWVGLVYEFGKDTPPGIVQDPRSGEVDLTPMEQKILNNLENRKVDFEAQKPEVVSQSPFVVTPQPVMPIKIVQPPIATVEQVEKNDLAKEITSQDE